MAKKSMKKYPTNRNHGIESMNDNIVNDLAELFDFSHWHHAEERYGMQHLARLYLICLMRGSKSYKSNLNCHHE